ncbi:putative transposase [Shigella dysenteriae 155-74]|uniref:IS911 protein n=1 Tax=Escherichia coli TaxID=562 RepID=A0A376JWI0_ECOLX|nr:transposase InsN for insertion sequence element B [Shigella dysenteriae 1012]EGI89116.1 putative transposase [Shigella dysenteriae 155-74]STE75023.1 IS911 protein [Escherichia coli]STL77417.1 IS911 protein [Escherichia coli]VDG95089.1 IS911 ORF1 [Shigella dysenteriae]
MKKRNFSAEFKRESAQLVVDQKYTVADAAKAMDVGLSTMTRWVKQLRCTGNSGHYHLFFF